MPTGLAVIGRFDNTIARQLDPAVSGVPNAHVAIDLTRAPAGALHPGIRALPRNNQLGSLISFGVLHCEFLFDRWRMGETRLRLFEFIFIHAIV